MSPGKHCERLDAWLREAGYQDSAWHELKRVPGERIVYRLVPHSGKPPVILKYKDHGCALPPAKMEIPAEVLDFYPDILMRCDTCAVRVEREAEGQRLDRVAHERTERAFFQAGVTVATLHTTDPPDRPPALIEALVEQIAVFVVQLRAAGVALDCLPPTSRLGEILCRHKGELARTWIHGDLKPDHIYLSDDGCRFIDADRLRIGLAIEDIASLLIHESWLHPKERLAARAFEQGYATVLPFPSPTELDVALLHAILRTIRNRISCQTSNALPAPLDALAAAWDRLSASARAPAHMRVPQPSGDVTRFHFPKPGIILAAGRGLRYARWSARKRKWSRRDTASDARLELAEGVLETPYWSEAWNTKVRRLKRLVFKPESRLVLKASLEGRRNRIIKLYSPGSFARKAAGFTWWRQAALTEPCLAPILGASDALNVVVMEQIRGVVLDTEGIRAEERLSEVAQLVRRFKDAARAQEIAGGSVESSRFPAVGCAQMLQQICQWLCRMAGAGLWPAEAINRLWEALEGSRCEMAGGGPYHLCHGDFVPGNVILDEGAGILRLIDADHLCLAPAYYDAAAFTAALLLDGRVTTEALTRFLRLCHGPQAQGSSLSLMVRVWILKLALAKLCRNRLGDEAIAVAGDALEAIRRSEEILDEDLHSLP